MDHSSYEMKIDNVAIQCGHVVNFVNINTPKRRKYNWGRRRNRSVDYRGQRDYIEKKYKKYGSDQIKRLINLLQEEGKKASNAAISCDITRISA